MSDMNSIYYYTNINYIPPGVLATNGIFSCAPDNGDLVKFRESGEFDIITIGKSNTLSEWDMAGTGYARTVEQNMITKKTLINGWMGVVGEDDVVLASRLWISHSTNHKRMSSDMMHKLVSMRIYISDDITDQVLLTPVFDWMTPVDHDRFLVQIEITKPEWDRFQRSITNTKEAEYGLTHQVKNYMTPISVLARVTNGPKSYLECMTEIINQYKLAGYHISTTIVSEWCPFPLPDYESYLFRQFMAEWMLKNVQGAIAEYKEDLEYHVYGVVKHARDPDSDSA